MEHVQHRVGAMGEWAAAAFLLRHGVQVLQRNVVVGRAEIDLLAEDETGPFVVEVKSGLASHDDHPRWNFTDRKAARVARAGRRLGTTRVDLITVVFDSDGINIEWHRRVA